MPIVEPLLYQLCKKTIKHVETVNRVLEFFSLVKISYDTEYGKMHDNLDWERTGFKL